MKKSSTIILLVILGVIALIFGIKAVSSTVVRVDSVADAALALSETRWDFGDIPMSGGIVTKEISFTNNSQTPITVIEMQTSCMCTTVQIAHADGNKSEAKGMVMGHGDSPAVSETIASGETAKLLVRFDPNAHGPNATGPVTRNVTLRTNSKKQPEIRMMFFGNVVK